MPAILAPQDFEFWLDNDGVEASAAVALLRPAPEEALELREIDDAVNRVGNDGPEIQRPAKSKEKPQQGSLF
jgi:putative SOS response-associated peptidase YedK